MSWPPGSGSPERGAEFLVNAEIYVSNAASHALLKKTPALRKPSRRDRNKADGGSVDESKKVREKSSWNSLARGPTATGQWRPATCKLREEGTRCLLNIYIEDSILFQTLAIHLVNHSDIRLIDTSLFFRKHCLGLYSRGQHTQRWIAGSPAEPVYLQFPTAEESSTWLALLRSYAVPEIYGRWPNAEDGGAYRMWRQVEISVIQARNLGNVRPLDANPNDSGSEPDPVDLDVSCVVMINGSLMGRTTVKKCIGSPDWHESFTLSDLPPFENLEVIVYREKTVKVFKPIMLGSVCINLGNFKRGETIEGWYPVVQPGPLASEVQIGDIRLKIHVDEEIILPAQAYEPLIEVLASRNFLDWVSDFEKKLKLKTITPHFIAVAAAKNSLVEEVQELAIREVDATSPSHQTLFRGNTLLTKVMEHCMSWYGKAFLEASIGSVLRKLCAEKVAIEVDPMRSGAKNSVKEVERNVDLLITWVQAFWTQIYSVRSECPYEMRRLFETIRKLVERRYQNTDTVYENRDLQWQSVSAFCFLRFIVPAILHPHLFGLCPGLPSQPVQRSLTLIAKVIQSLANLNTTVQKEEFMRGLKNFLNDSLPAMIDYIVVVSTPDDRDHFSVAVGSDRGRPERLEIMKGLQERVSLMPTLIAEGVPKPPHLLDVPRNLAVVVSSVIRHSRTFLNTTPVPGDENDLKLRELCTRCYEVEEIALQRVSRLASEVTTAIAQQEEEWQNGHEGGGASLISSSSSSDGRKRHQAGGSSPSVDASNYTQDDLAMPRSPTKLMHKPRLRHLKSTSTDSIPARDAGATADDDQASVRVHKRGFLRQIFGSG
ncbi:Rho GTPase activation protein [Cylindrobasidium torrendii FP15055 ss-10]|uniref:Rho GTPase activation protein n=1 Tax=Cylindrobasidium torrendii FP15055 ss-10 TaxID=1314674 RepID=A0A0D7BN52_9AGAR|nr:Rho GTPase activation protein [Cylindrobasidium torrendii FP15055 ss-10]